MFPNSRPRCHPVTCPDAIGPEKLDHVFSETRAEPSPQHHHLHREGEEQRPVERMGVEFTESLRLENTCKITKSNLSPALPGLTLSHGCQRAAIQAG